MKTPASTEDVQLGSAESAQNGGGGYLIDSVISSYDLTEEFELKKKKLELLKNKQRLMEELPHKYGFNFYQWQLDFRNARYNKNRLLTAANQVGKSVIQIAECIEMATNMALWPSLWRRSPRVFFYFYPNAQTLQREFDSKWIPDLLPRGSLKNHPVYGWRIEKNNGTVSALKFNSGVSVYFMSYSMSVMNLQASTVDAVFCFTGRNLITTSRGYKRMDRIKIGDLVWTKEGEWKPVDNIYKREAPLTIRRILSSGEYVDATPDHLIWDGEKWVKFSNLTSTDVLSRYAPCSKKKFLYTEGLHIKDILKTNIKVSTTFNAKVVSRVGTYISKFGKITLVISLKDMLCIIWTRTLQTIRLLTWPVCRRVSTLDYTKLKSGLTGHLDCKEIKNVFSVVIVSLLEQLKKLPHLFALRNVGEFLKEQKECVLFAVKNLLKSQTAPMKDLHALTGALSLREKKVFCINVRDNHNFQVCDIIAKNCDEELPENYWDELNFRRKATNGYFSMVFTATLGQKLWYDTMERQGESDEKFPTAWKKQVSLFDCKFYSDGTPSHVDDEYIQSAISFCKNEAEVQKRVYGRFALDSGLKYPQFDRAQHVIPSHPIDPRWQLFAGVDIGAGGADNHPSTIIFVAVNPDYTKAEAFQAWKGDKVVTTDMDVYEKLVELMEDRPFTVFYDYHAKDFSTICKRRGLPVLKADKRHDVGESVINVLFKTNALHLHQTPEMEDLTYELTTLQSSTDKRKAKDDLTDALRYALTRIPFSWEKMGINLKEKQHALTPEYTEDKLHQMERRKRGSKESDSYNFDNEIQEWADMYDV